jgi:hypothetical protein
MRRADSAERLVAWHDSASSSDGAHYPLARAQALAAAESWERLERLAASLAAAGPSTREVATLQGLARAMRGDRAGAERIASALLRAAGRFGRSSAQTSAAVIAAALGDKARAVSLLRQANPPSGFRTDLYHFSRPSIYGMLRGYAPFEALIRLQP